MTTEYKMVLKKNAVIKQSGTVYKELMNQNLNAEMATCPYAKEISNQKNAAL